MNVASGTRGVLTNLVPQQSGVTGALDLQALQGGDWEVWFGMGGNLTIVIDNSLLL